tara:strand:+ start:11296 stop:12726 length:1431 start_codon:yes stop_codon:yes gene_type:complete
MKLPKKKWSRILGIWFALHCTSGAWANWGGSQIKEIQKLVQAQVARGQAQESDSTSSEGPSNVKMGGSACTSEMMIEGAIGPATQDSLERNLELTKEWGCKSMLITINTPGGALPATRKIVTTILNSPIPILCLISPSGAHAGSAGAIIMQSCHVSGAMVATNIGAATPVSGAQKEIPDDLRKKLINDTVSWMEGVTKLRKRNLEFSKEIITEAKAVSAREAVKLGAIDFLAETKQEFLDYAHGRTVLLTEKTTTQVVVGDLKPIGSDLRENILKLVANPQVAYMMFMGSLALIYFELTHPGTIVPGVVGAIGLVFSLISLDMMEVTWAGVALIVLGIGFLIGEAFLPSFGMLGLGGIAAFVFGSIILFDEAKTGYELPIHMIVASSLGLGVITMMIAYAAFNVRKTRVRGSAEEMLDRVSQVNSVKEGQPNQGKAKVLGELWNIRSSHELSEGMKIKVVEVKGLTLIVEPTNEES